MEHGSKTSPHQEVGTTGAGAHPPKGQRTARPRTRGAQTLRWFPRILGLVVTLALLIGLITLVRATSLGPAPANSTTGTKTTSSSTTSSPQAAPDFTLATLGGGSFHLADQRGHVVVLYFLESTCPSCVQESRDLVQALLSAKTPGAQALTIDVSPGDSPSDLQAFVQTVGVPATAPIRWGIDTNGAISSAYGVQNMGTTVVIDAHGRLAYQSNGPVPPEQLAQIVRKLA